MQHYVHAALLIQHWRGSKSNQSRQRSWLFMYVGSVLRLSPLGNMWHSAAWRGMMRTERCALSSCTAAGRTQTYWRMGGGKAQLCRGSLGWPDLGSSYSSISGTVPYTRGRRNNWQTQGRPWPKLYSLLKREGFKRKQSTKKNGFCIYHHRDKARLSN